jgi:hypothetical protein
MLLSVGSLWAMLGEQGFGWRAIGLMSDLFGTSVESDRVAVGCPAGLRHVRDSETLEAVDAEN